MAIKKITTKAGNLMHDAFLNKEVYELLDKQDKKYYDKLKKRDKERAANELKDQVEENGDKRKKLKLLKPFTKKHKLCDDICNVILSFL